MALERGNGAGECRLGVFGAGRCLEESRSPCRLKSVGGAVEPHIDTWSARDTIAFSEPLGFLTVRAHKPVRADHNVRGMK